MSSKGFSLIELIVTLGVSAVLSLVVAQSMATNQQRIGKIEESLVAQQLDATVTTAFSGKVGSEVLKAWVDGSPSLSDWPTVTNLAGYSRPPFFNPVGLQCPSSNNLYSGTIEEAQYRIPVDVLSIQTPFAVKGRSLQNRASLKVSDIHMVLQGDAANNCPDLARCRVKGDCVFKLGLELKRVGKDGIESPFRKLSYLLYCKTTSLLPTQEQIESCRLMSAVQSTEPFDCDYQAFMTAWDGGVVPSADLNGDGGVDSGDIEAYFSVCRRCVGDLNWDGRTDALDIEHVTAFWGNVPQAMAWGNRFKGIVPPAISVEEIEWVGLTDGAWPSPAPSPTYLVDDFEAFSVIAREADLDQDGWVTGGDLGFVLADFGCVEKKPRACFEDTPIYPLMERAKKFAPPVSGPGALNGLDRGALGSCTGVANQDRAMADDPHCLSMNLNGKCEIPEEQLADPTAPDNPLYCRRRMDGTHLNQWVAVGQADLAVMDYLLKMQGVIHRYRKTQGSNGTACSVTADPPSN